MSRETVISLAKKWYNLISFPKKYDDMFEKLLEQEQDLQCMKFEDYDIKGNSQRKGKNLIMFLYFCEELSEKYKSAGISQEILMATIDDFIINVEREYILSGKMGLVKASIFRNHFSMCLFRLGRLQFCMDEAPRDVPEKGIKKGDNVIDVHIPAGDSLSMEQCKQNFAEAEEFFKKYFQDFKYSYYTCFSWMLDKTLKNFLSENSNILKFQKFFEVVYEWEYDAVLNFIFKYGIESRDEMKTLPAETSFAKKLKEYALSGGKLYNNLGVRERGLIGTEIK